jgi:hypothetical protein
MRGEGDAPLPWPPVLTSDDEINAWIHDTDQNRSLAGVLAEHEDTFGRLRTAVAEMPAELLTDPGAVPWMEGRTIGDAIVSGDYFGHLHEEHEPDIRAWLDGQSPS